MNHPDPKTYGMQIVTKDQFFAYVGPRNIHPSVQGSSNGPYGLHSHWKNLNTGALVGMSFGHGDKSVYMLKTELVGA